MKDHLDKNAEIKTGCRAGYKGKEAHLPQFVHEKSGKKGKNFKQRHWMIMLFKAWLRPPPFG